MGTASFASQRSKDPVRQVGAVIVNGKNRIVSVGYNGMPPGISDDEDVWGKDPSNPLNNKKYLVCHAEANALANTTEKVEGCVVYITHFPCNECAKLLSINGIKKIIYANDYGKEMKKISMRILKAAGIDIESYTGRDTFSIDIHEWKNVGPTPGTEADTERHRDG